jgi:hypothetical protein
MGNSQQPKNSSFLQKTIQGFDVGIACTGVNVVTDIFEPTDGYDRRLAGKLDVGDEIVEVDGTSVVGWKHQMLSRKLDEQLFIRLLLFALPFNRSYNLFILCLRSTTTTQQGMIPPSCTAETTKSKSGGSNKFETVLLVCRRPIDDPVPPVRPPKISLLLPPPPYTVSQLLEIIF